MQPLPTSRSNQERPREGRWSLARILGRPASSWSATCSTSCESYFNRRTCVQDKKLPEYRPWSSTNRPANLTFNTHQGVLYSFHFLELGLVVWELESNRACLGIPKSSSEVWYSSYIFPFDILLIQVIFFILSSQIYFSHLFIFPSYSTCAQKFCPLA
jgi:hypothetical protein